jgi:hypothetical protein
MRLAAFNVNELAKSNIGTTFKLVLFAFFLRSSMLQASRPIATVAGIRVRGSQRLDLRGVLYLRSFQSPSRFAGSTDSPELLP